MIFGHDTKFIKTKDHNTKYLFICLRKQYVVTLLRCMKTEDLKVRNNYILQSNSNRIGTN